MDIQLDVNGKTAGAALAIPESGRGPGVLLLHAWWGLNPYFKTLCQRFAEEGFFCLAPDMFQGETALTVEEAEALEGRREDERWVGDVVMAARNHLLAHPACSSDRVAVVGFSFGAAWTLVAAAREPEKVAAAVLFYGIWRADFESMRAAVLGHFSDADEWEPYDNTLEMERQMRAAGLDVTMHVYPGRAHWFMETDRPEYNEAAAELAWERTISFLKETMDAKDTLTTMFTHHRWANLKLLDCCAGLTPDQFDASSVGGFGSLRETLEHITSAERSYFSRISTGQRFVRPADEPPMTIETMREILDTTGIGLIDWAARVQAGDVVVIDWDGTLRDVPKSIILTQVINHATEHRAQVNAILTLLGIEAPELDAWQFFDSKAA